MAARDAVTAAFAGIAETEHLLFIRDLIPYTRWLGPYDRLEPWQGREVTPVRHVPSRSRRVAPTLRAGSALAVSGRATAGRCPAAQTGSATPRFRVSRAH